MVVIFTTIIDASIWIQNPLRNIGCWSIHCLLYRLYICNVVHEHRRSRAANYECEIGQ